MSTGVKKYNLPDQGSTQWWANPLTPVVADLAARVDALEARQPDVHAALPYARVDQLIYSGVPLVPLVSLGGGAADLHHTANVALGTESAYVRTPGVPGVACGFGVFSSTAFDMTGKEAVLWLRIEGMTHTPDFKFWVGDNSFAHAYTWNINESGTQFPFLRDGDFYRITLPFGAAVVAGAGAPTLSALTSWQVAIYDDGHPIDFWLGGFGFVTRQTKYPNGVVTIRFDDLFRSNLTTAAPIMDKFGYRATSYVIAQTLNENAKFFPTYATLDEAHQLEEIHGWEHGSHSYSAKLHNQVASQGGTGVNGYLAYPPDVQFTDMKLCRDYMRRQGFRAPDHFAWPQGAWDDPARRMANQVFTSQITLAHPGNETIPPADPTRVRCYSPPMTVTGAQLTAEVDKCIAGKEWLTVLFHNIVTTPVSSVDTSTAAFTTFVNYLNANNVPVRLATEVLSIPVT